MSSSPTALFSNLLIKLGLEKPPVPAAAPAPKADDMLETKRQRLSTVLKNMGEYMRGIEDRMTLLHVAAHRLRLVGAAPSEPSQALASQLPMIEALLRENQRAAQVVGSVLARYIQATEELAQTREAVETGAFWNLREEDSRAKIYFLVRIPQILSEFPILCNLFPATEEKTATPLLAPKKGLTAAKEGDPYGVQFLKSLGKRMTILNAALHLARGNTKSLEQFPPVTQTQVRNLANLLSKDLSLSKLVHEIVVRYQEAIALIAKIPPEDVARLAVLQEFLMTLPRRVQGNPLMEQILT